MKAGSIYLVRHGATKLNSTDDASQDRERGWTDVPLTENGREEARKAAEELKDKGVAVIDSSDLVRAKETAQIIGEVLGIKPTFSHKLRPWNLGKFAGQKLKEAGPEIADYCANRPDEPVPEGESFNQFKTRAFAGIAEACRKAQGQTLALITHHRVERLIEAWQQNGQPADHSISCRVFLQKGDPPGGVEELFLNRQALGNGGMADNAQPNGTDQGAKLSHAAVHYGMAKPNGDKCSACEHFQGKDSCDLVVAPIYPGGWCDKFERKEAGDGADAGGGATISGASQPAVPNMSGNGTAGGPGAPGMAAANGDASHTLAHGRAIGGAHALHAVGHISEKERDRHIKKSTAAITKAKRKPFGAFAP